jgi:hypothetical protein
MKTTLEIPGPIFRRAKAKAAEHGVPLRRFVSEAVAEKLRMKSSAQAGARRRLAGSLCHLRKETARINALIEGEFERIEPEEGT